MKKQSVLNLFITIAGSLLLFSCSNNKASQAETNKTIADTAEVKANTATDTTTLIVSPVAKDKDEAKEKEENEENEKKEKD